MIHNGLLTVSNVTPLKYKLRQVGQLTIISIIVSQLFGQSGRLVLRCEMTAQWSLAGVPVPRTRAARFCICPNLLKCRNKHGQTLKNLT